MDDRQSAILWQLMQSLSPQTQDGPASHSQEQPFEHTLLSLRPLLPPKQQKILDLMIKLHEINALIHELNQ